MPNTGNSYITTLQDAHLKWGSHRHTSTRGTVYGEGYLQIPKHVAEAYNIYNSNQPNAITIYNCSSIDGFLNNVLLKASGSSFRGDPFAKQFQGSGHLKLLGDWFHHVNAVVGDRVKIVFTSPKDMLIEKL
ncbi:hypothetical protein C1I59_00590 [Paenibacillus polymyxa]|uniref:hypothetical protein n=1 Tax=Paenibacillus polymyxa TaxID=1406 RepID=UPI0010BF60B2|nr:hypothetical protein [Paenibacillus polymyxa]TKH40304.1 hypothetical protein C1I59_00590 [Paenibacillus polymyxa]